MIITSINVSYKIEPLSNHQIFLWFMFISSYWSVYAAYSSLTTFCPCRKNLEGHVFGWEAPIHARSGASEGPAHHRLSQLQVQATQEEAAEEGHQSPRRRHCHPSPLALQLWFHGTPQPCPSPPEPAATLLKHACVSKLPSPLRLPNRSSFRSSIGSIGRRFLKQARGVPKLKHAIIPSRVSGVFWQSARTRAVLFVQLCSF